MRVPEETPTPLGVTRRGFLAMALLFAWRPMPPAAGHPEPRRGVTSRKVLSADKVPERLRPAYGAVRRHPAVFDGVLCPCGCHGDDRSILVCFESTEPVDCGMCERAVTVVADTLAAGGGLADARSAVDRRFGPPR